MIEEKTHIKLICGCERSACVLQCRLETLDFDRPESKIWTLDSKTEIIHTFCSPREYTFIAVGYIVVAFHLTNT